MKKRTKGVVQFDDADLENMSIKTSILTEDDYHEELDRVKSKGDPVVVRELAIYRIGKGYRIADKNDLKFHIEAADREDLHEKLVDSFLMTVEEKGTIMTPEQKVKARAKLRESIGLEMIEGMINSAKPWPEGLLH